MPLLCIDFSTTVLRFLVKTESQFSECQISTIKKSNSILTHINTALNDINLRVQQITKIGYINSGTSFTGLRVAASIAMSMAYISKAEIFSVDPYNIITKQYMNNSISQDQKYYIVILPNNNSSTMKWGLVLHNNSQYQLLHTDTLNFKNEPLLIIPKNNKFKGLKIKLLHSLQRHELIKLINYNDYIDDTTYIDSINLHYLAELIINNNIPKTDIMAADLHY